MKTTLNNIAKYDRRGLYFVSVGDKDCLHAMQFLVGNMRAANSLAYYLAKTLRDEWIITIHNAGREHNVQGVGRIARGHFNHDEMLALNGERLPLMQVGQFGTRNAPLPLYRVP